MIQGPFTKRRPWLFPWLVLGIYLLGVSVAFASAIGGLQADLTPPAPATVSPEPLSASDTHVADPCGLDAVTCSEEASAATGHLVYAISVYTYQADPRQTDSDPCHTANGTDICPDGVAFDLPPFGVVANNCLDFGTEVWIRGQQYFVLDRMNSRYGCDVFDILIPLDAAPWAWHNEPVTVID